MPPTEAGAFALAEARGHDEKHFDRPSKRNSRPRSKTRPDHAGAATGMVTGVDRGRYTVLLGDPPTQITAMKARELTRERIVVGDQVDVVGDTTGQPGTLARIVRVAERTSVLRRTADDNDPYERVIVANADQLMIVAACANPEPRMGMIDRAVVAAYEAGMVATLVLTKADLASPEPLLRLYEPAGVQVIVTRPAERAADEARTGPTDAARTLALDPLLVAEVRAALLGKVTVLLGHSGVGKSTLVNALVPGAGRSTGAVNTTTGRGRQTTTAAEALALPGGQGWVVDTPGIRSLGVAHVRTEQVLAAFPDLADIAEDACPRGCSHLDTAPDCALDGWANDNPALRETRELRLGSLRRLLTARAAAKGDLANHASQLQRRSAS